MVEELDGGGMPVARYAQGLGIDEPLAMSRGGVNYFYNADGLGSVTSLSSSAGSLTNTYTYDSFGKLTASTGTVTNPFRYTGREYDSDTGLYYYRARYYDPSVGRFVSEDPLELRGGVNFYSYAFENPANWTDPYGLDTQVCQRPVAFPGLGNYTHTFLYSTESNTGYGLTTPSPYIPLVPFVPVPGKIEKDYPYDASGKEKKGYQCNTVSKNKCVESCVNKKATEPPPKYYLGHYQCDTWANDVLRQCKKECRQ